MQKGHWLGLSVYGVSPFKKQGSATYMDQFNINSWRHTRSIDLLIRLKGEQ